VSAVAEDQQGKRVVLNGLGDRLEPRTAADDGGALLKQGETCYVHPDGVNYGSFFIPNNLPPGKYTITVTLSNQVDNTSIFKTWTGTAAAPPITIEIPKER